MVHSASNKSTTFCVVACVRAAIFIKVNFFAAAFGINGITKNGVCFRVKRLEQEKVGEGRGGWPV